MLESKVVIAILAWLAGIAASVVTQQILRRRSVLSYFVTHFRVGASATDKIFGDVKITWNNSSVPNLYLSTVELINESSRDLENVHINAFTNDTSLLSEYPQLLGTSHFIKYSPEYEKILQVNPGGAPEQEQRETYGKRREYIVPILNRGQAIRFQFLNTSKSENQPTIWLEVLHPGVVLKFRPPQQLIYGVPQPWAALTGGLLGIGFATVLYAYSPWSWLTAFGCLAFGFIAQIPGAHILRIGRAIRQWLVG